MGSTSYEKEIRVPRTKRRRNPYAQGRKILSFEFLRKKKNRKKEEPCIGAPVCAEGKRERFVCGIRVPNHGKGSLLEGQRPDVPKKSPGESMSGGEKRADGQKKATCQKSCN